MRLRTEPALPLMLIMSAIDVLLCGFTATVTLFLIGAGAGLGEGTMREENAFTASVAPTVIVSLVDTRRSPCWRAADVSEVSRYSGPSTDCGSNPTFFVYRRISSANPLVLRSRAGEGFVAMLSLDDGVNASVTHRIDCKSDSEVLLAISAMSDVAIREGVCNTAVLREGS